MSDKEKTVTLTKQEFIRLMAITRYARYLCGDNIFICRTEEDAKKIFSGMINSITDIEEDIYKNWKKAQNDKKGEGELR